MLDVYFRLILSIEQHLRFSEGLSCASATGAGSRSCTQRVTRSRSVNEEDFKDDFKRDRLLCSAACRGQAGCGDEAQITRRSPARSGRIVLDKGVLFNPLSNT